jgi:hypothetical protein
MRLFGRVPNQPVLPAGWLGYEVEPSVPKNRSLALWADFLRALSHADKDAAVSLSYSDSVCCAEGHEADSRFSGITESSAEVDAVRDFIFAIFRSSR